MSAQRLLIGVLLSLVAVAILLAVLLFQPPVIEAELTFDELIAFSDARMNLVKEALITYEVNLSLINNSISGELIYYKNSSVESVTLSPELIGYEGYALLISPNQLINFINNSARREYSGELENNGLACQSSITEPLSNDYKSLINGSYLFVTCFDKTIGYPSLYYNSELLGEDVVYSKIFIKNITYKL
ncbi:MAG: hypothetical protein WC307_04135 [Candidatus Nanoarchaeia archaeon]|jgi:hypothetical protein